ncbi:hypothetical protein [Stieleria neptunia]|uniref:hypothetical protein n=1 Tax=Stieleria neptunia TaxID=2527979 RepID=UPI001E30B160|nr:hypothetical protein [Stieleria neptunia]
MDTYYQDEFLHGFALDVDPVYVALLRSQQPLRELNDALDAELVPAGWPEHCRQRNFANVMSPVRVIIYSGVDPDTYRKTRNIPLTIGQIHEVLIELRGPFIAASGHGKHRPLIGGICVGNAGRGDGGTLGGFVKQRGTSDPELLSCQHVLVDSSSTDILQRSKNHGGSAPSESIGTVSHQVPLTITQTYTHGAPYNEVDACLAKVDATVPVTAGSIRLTTAPTSTSSTASMSLGDDVEFVGKESDRKHANILRFISRQKISIDNNTYNFGDFFEIYTTSTIPLAVRGDSGSWVLRNVTSNSSELCGLLFAIDTSATDRAFCCFIESVIDKLNNVSGADYELY